MRTQAHTEALARTRTWIRQIGAVLELLGEGRPDQDDRPPCLTDVLGDPQPCIPEYGITVPRRSRDDTPQHVAVHGHAFMKGSREVQRDRCLPRAARAREDKERELHETAPMAAERADGEGASRVDLFVDAILAAVGTDVEHDRSLPECQSKLSGHCCA